MIRITPRLHLRENIRIHYPRGSKAVQTDNDLVANLVGLGQPHFDWSIFMPVLGVRGRAVSFKNASITG